MAFSGLRVVFSPGRSSLRQWFMHEVPLDRCVYADAGHSRFVPKHTHARAYAYCVLVLRTSFAARGNTRVTARMRERNCFIYEWIQSLSHRPRRRCIANYNRSPQNNLGHGRGLLSQTVFAYRPDTYAVRRADANS